MISVFRTLRIPTISFSLFYYPLLGMYETRSKKTRMEISAHSGTLAKFAFLGIPCLHPIVLIHVGLVYGWIGFWSMFLGTALITGLGLTKTGYGERFENAGQGIIRKSVGGMLIAFGMVVSPYEGLFVLRSWAITLVVILLLARIITRD